MLVNIKGKLLDLTSPKVMGILNVNQDSFYEKSRINSESALLKMAEKMLNEGASILDIGGQSTKPNAEIIDEDLELKSVNWALEILMKNFPDSYISVDTFYSKVAKYSIEAGAGMINDVSGGNLDAKMFETVAQLNVPYVLMHSRGNSKTMNNLTEYDDVVLEVLDDLQEKSFQLKQLGQKDIIIDLGFGFAKTLEQNYQLLNALEDYKILGMPILAGFSRKSMIWKPLKIQADEALNGTTVLNTLAIQKGANILRVHDVKEAMEVIELMKIVSENPQNQML